MLKKRLENQAFQPLISDIYKLQINEIKHSRILDYKEFKFGLLILAVQL
jgi:hypothetical protein